MKRGAFHRPSGPGRTSGPGLPPRLVHLAQLVAAALVAGGVYTGVRLFAPATRVHALPEYATRTGEQCATCHVSPGGGGPRTLRGLLWAARGRPDRVPELPNVLLAPGLESGRELYDAACAACHGSRGEGLFGSALADSALRAAKIRSSVLRGRTRSGMPAFKGRFTASQLDALVTFVQDLARGAGEKLADSYPVPAGRLGCDSQPTPAGAACPAN